MILIAIFIIFRDSKVESTNEGKIDVESSAGENCNINDNNTERYIMFDEFMVRLVQVLYSLALEILCYF